jgi:hypothetical protein
VARAGAQHVGASRRRVHALEGESSPVGIGSDCCTNTGGVGVSDNALRHAATTSLSAASPIRRTTPWRSRGTDLGDRQTSPNSGRLAALSRRWTHAGAIVAVPTVPLPDRAAIPHDQAMPGTTARQHLKHQRTHRGCAPVDRGHHEGMNAADGRRQPGHESPRRERLLAAVIPVPLQRPIPHTPQPLPQLPTTRLPAVEPDSLVLGMARLDRSGRVHDHAVLALLCVPTFEVDLEF